MALQMIEPLQADTYLQALGEFPDMIVDALFAHEPEGWGAILERYSFGGMDRAAGELLRTDYNAQLRQAQTMTQRLRIANNILAWGKMQPIDYDLADSCLAALDLLDTDVSLNPDMIEVRRIASVSKIYEMWAPEAWIIYDSYCAIGLQWLVSQVWSNRGDVVHAGLVRFPCPPPRASQSTYLRIPHSRFQAAGFAWLPLLLLACSRNREILKSDR